MKKLYLAIGAISLVAFAALVIAWAYDTDGGFDIWEQGICMDDYGNHTDKCLPKSIKYPNHLQEWYPTNDTNSSYCTSTIVNCGDYNATCIDGECVLSNRSF